MFMEQPIYYENADGDSIPAVVKRVMPKTLLVEISGETKTRRVKKSSCYYQETAGGYIDADRLERLMFTNSNDIPEPIIILGDVCRWSGIGLVHERAATAEDYRLYPQVIEKKYARWYEWK